MTWTSVPWMEVILGVSGVAALRSSLRFFFPGLASRPIPWQGLALHKPWEPFPPPAAKDAARKSDEVIEHLVDELVQQLGVGVLLFDQELCLRSVNAHAASLVGDGMPGKFATEFLPRSLASAVLECWQDKLNTVSDPTVLAKQGEGPQTLQGVALLLRDSSKEFYGVALLLLPATQPSAQRDTLEPGTGPQRMRHLASIGMHAAGMAHDIKNPLVALKTFAELLPAKFEDPEFRETFSKIAVAQIRRIDGMVNNLLDYARPKKPEGAPEDPVKILREAVSILGMQLAEKKIRIQEKNLPQDSRVWLDAEQIRRVLINILENAIEAMPQGGCIEMEVRQEPDAFHILISDTGPGISPQDSKRIFEPFYSTKKKGSGLGLAIAKRIVDDHGGAMEFRNAQPGPGGMCVITLPAKREAAKRDYSKDRLSSDRDLPPSPLMGEGRGGGDKPDEPPIRTFPLKGGRR